MRGDDHDGGSGLELRRLEQRKAVAGRNVEIEEHDIGLRGAQGGDGVGVARGFADEFEFVLGGQQTAQAVGGGWFVFDDEGAESHVALGEGCSAAWKGKAQRTAKPRSRPAESRAPDGG